MTDQELFALDRMGFIPGPDEGEAEFVLRVARTKEKFEKGGWISEAHWDWVRHHLDQMFNVKPLYICAFYSNQGLTPWQGAASWIEGRTLDSVQLRAALKKGTYLGLYSREEILAHEAVHAARSGFEESRYEEFFAYQSSSKRWRRVLGPIVKRPWELWPLLTAFTGAIFWPACYVFAALWLGLGFFRLIREHRVLRRASQQILNLGKGARAARAILLRLSDEEILAFAKGRSIQEYAQEQKCLRWKIIRNYLKDV